MARGRTGRPIGLTAEITRQIAGLMTRGLPFESSCLFARVLPSTAYLWLQRGEAAKAALEGGVSPKPNDALCLDFFESVKRAEVAAQDKLLASISQAATEPGVKVQWTAAAWILERRWPHLYAQKTFVELPKGDDSLEKFVVAISKGRREYRRNKGLASGKQGAQEETPDET